MNIACFDCKKIFNYVTETFICPHCGYLNPILDVDYFSYIGIEKNINVDLADLENKFTTLMIKYHPDNFVNGSETEKINSLKHSSYLNQSYNILKSLTTRFFYLYKITNNEDLISENEADSNNQQLFLQFMEYYEELEKIYSYDSLKDFQNKLETLKSNVITESSQMDFTSKEWALPIYLQLKYIDRILELSHKKKI